MARPDGKGASGGMGRLRMLVNTPMTSCSNPVLVATIASRGAHSAPSLTSRAASTPAARATPQPTPVHEEPEHETKGPQLARTSSAAPRHRPSLAARWQRRVAAQQAQAAQRLRELEEARRHLVEHEVAAAEHKPGELKGQDGARLYPAPTPTGKPELHLDLPQGTVGSVVQGWGGSQAGSHSPPVSRRASHSAAEKSTAPPDSPPMRLTIAAVREGSDLPLMASPKRSTGLAPAAPVSFLPVPPSFAPPGLGEGARATAALTGSLAEDGASAGGHIRRPGMSEPVASPRRGPLPFPPTQTLISSQLLSEEQPDREASSGESAAQDEGWGHGASPAPAPAPAPTPTPVPKRLAEAKPAEESDVPSWMQRPASPVPPPLPTPPYDSDVPFWLRQSVAPAPAPTPAPASSQASSQASTQTPAEPQVERVASTGTPPQPSQPSRKGRRARTLTAEQEALLVRTLSPKHSAAKAPGGGPLFDEPPPAPDSGSLSPRGRAQTSDSDALYLPLPGWQPASVAPAPSSAPRLQVTIAPATSTSLPQPSPLQASQGPLLVGIRSTPQAGPWQAPTVPETHPVLPSHPRTPRAEASQGSSTPAPGSPSSTASVTGRGPVPELSPALPGDVPSHSLQGMGGELMAAARAEQPLRLPIQGDGSTPANHSRRRAASVESAGRVAELRRQHTSRGSGSSPLAPGQAAPASPTPSSDSEDDEYAGLRPRAASSPAAHMTQAHISLYKRTLQPTASPTHLVNAHLSLQRRMSQGREAEPAPAHSSVAQAQALVPDRRAPRPATVQAPRPNRQRITQLLYGVNTPPRDPVAAETALASRRGRAEEHALACAEADEVGEEAGGVAPAVPLRGGLVAEEAAVADARDRGQTLQPDMEHFYAMDGFSKEDLAALGVGDVPLPAQAEAEEAAAGGGGVPGDMSLGNLFADMPVVEGGDAGELDLEALLDEQWMQQQHGFLRDGKEG